MPKYSLYSLITILYLLLLVAVGSMPFGFYLLPLGFSGLISVYNIIYYYKNLQKQTYIQIALWVTIFINSFVSPIIHFSNDFWLLNMPYMTSNWEVPAFWISFMYLVGMVIIKIVMSNSLSTTQKVVKSVWSYNNRAKIVVILCMIFSFLLQSYIYVRMGGISGYINAYMTEDRAESSFSGMGLFFIFSEIFPYLLILLFDILFRNKKVKAFTAFAFLGLLFLSAMYFGGLRGSRSNTLLTLIFGFLVINNSHYKFKRLHYVSFIAFFFIFMFVGRIYKDKSSYSLYDYIESAQAKTDNSDISSTENIITLDLSRFAINCHQLHRLEDVDYDYKYGQTYIDGLLTFFPGGGIIRDKFQLSGRSASATELFYIDKPRKSTRILGIIGEWFINFGLYTFFIPYIILSFFLNFAVKKLGGFALSDPRQILVMIFVVMVPNLILSDMNNIAFVFVKRFFLIYILLYFITDKYCKPQNL